jgi:hypothetical protein
MIDPIPPVEGLIPYRLYSASPVSSRIEHDEKNTPVCVLGPILTHTIVEPVFSLTPTRHWS